jgi:hypothetical protein
MPMLAHLAGRQCYYNIYIIDVTTFDNLVIGKVQVDEEEEVDGGHSDANEKLLAPAWCPRCQDGDHPGSRETAKYYKQQVEEQVIVTRVNNRAQ